MPVRIWFEEARREAGPGGEPIVGVLDRILREAADRGASDVHFQPGKEGVEIRIRRDGTLYRLGTLPATHTAQIAARLKVLAHLLTYKVDVPQEGRIRAGRVAGIEKEMRISTAPTLFGERVVVRFFETQERFARLADLGFPPDVEQSLARAIRRTSGVILLTGPAGCGKTTAAYALLREIAAQVRSAALPGFPDAVPLRSIVSLEDPVEREIDGVAQIEVDSRNEPELPQMLKYIVRQDPEIIMIGEIRDRETARTAMQAALTGHLIISTFHAGSAAEAVGRLLDIGIEPFVLRSVLTRVVNQRLLRKKCPCTADDASGDCPHCGNTGYAGRFLIAESLPLDREEIGRALFERPDARTLQRLAEQAGMVSLAARIANALAAGRISAEEAASVTTDDCS